MVPLSTRWGNAIVAALVAVLAAPAPAVAAEGSLKNILQKMDMIAEGVETAKSAYRLSLKHKVSMPITREVYNILYKNKSPQEAVGDLMERSLKSE